MHKTGNDVHQKRDLKVCMGLSCTKNFAKDIVRRAKKRNDVRVSTCCCMGYCGLAPNIMIDGTVVNEVNPAEIDTILEGKTAEGAPRGRKKLPMSGPPILDDNGLESVRDLLDI